jgi:hypothetical protein
LSLSALAALTLAAPAVAQAPVSPRGNFGGGALVAPPSDLFGAGNAVVALRALPKRQLEIEATVRARCAGGDISATTTIAADGSFRSKGTVTQQPGPAEKVTTRYTLSGRFTAAGAAEGTVSATIERSVQGRVTSCRSGTVQFGVRRPTTGVGTPGAPKATRYYGTTAQKSVGPNRPIVLRISGDGKRVTRALFGYSVKCSDGKLAIGVEAPRTNITIDSHGIVRDRDASTETQGEVVVHIDDHFMAQLGERGARGTLSLSDRTTDRASGRTIQTCKSGTIRWRASR